MGGAEYLTFEFLVCSAAAVSREKKIKIKNKKQPQTCGDVTAAFSQRVLRFGAGPSLRVFTQKIKNKKRTNQSTRAENSSKNRLIRTHSLVIT